MPLKYRLDELGWHGFERITQSLLKAEIGIGIENWSGHSDLGRDAYCPADLHFPERSVLSKGPFVFQVKFVRGANAAGAQPFALVRNAIKAEIKTIKQRMASRVWQAPRSYVLLTNAPLTAKRRIELRELLGAALSDAIVFSLGATDICDLLDKAPEIRKSHPEILGLSDLQALIREAASPAILERSAAAIQEAEEVSRVFVATRAYRETLDLLSRHNFVVLDGPPEMGKTAIARMVALAKVLDQWTAIECRSPDEFFASWITSSRQIFIADDALGRTEFDITLGRQWERDLPRIIRRIDANHWLVWTTRKHILARALSSMDLTSPAEAFPLPSEVIVDASGLTTEEKAQILYRHAKNAILGDNHIALIREFAPRIVKSNFFTPERIRRFVQEGLPEISDSINEGSLDSTTLNALIDEAIQSPTKRMRRAFAGLPATHRSLLVDMLECKSYCTPDSLLEVYRSRHGAITVSAFREAVDDLIGTFIKVKYSTSLDWIHPSYRDIVIDAVSEDAGLQMEFLRTATLQGLSLAFSTEGGANGSRRMPFMQCPDSWPLAGDLLATAIRGPGLPQVVDIVRNVFLETRDNVKTVGQADRLIATVLDALNESLRGSRPLRTQDIEALRRLFSVDGVDPPDFELTGLLCSRLSEIQQELRADPEFDSGLVQEVFALVNWIQRFEPATLFDVSITCKLDSILELIYEYAGYEAEAQVDEYGDYDEDIAECERLSAAFESLNYGDIERATDIAYMLDMQREEYEEYQNPEESFEDENDLLGGTRTSSFDVTVFFSDL